LATPRPLDIELVDIELGDFTVDKTGASNP
jgi:hypothetical protein